MSCTDGCRASKVSPILLPRTHWTDHPNYPYQTLLLRSHASFRQLSAALLRRARDASTPAFRNADSLRFRSWQRAMRGHEHYEEHKLYRYLRARFDVSTAELSGDHQHLHELADAVDEAYRAGSDTALVAAIRTYDDLLCRHLDDEENLVIPLLLQLSRSEFDQYSHGAIGALLADFERCAEVDAV